jgi:hypothetical protein
VYAPLFSLAVYCMRRSLFTLLIHYWFAACRSLGVNLRMKGPFAKEWLVLLLPPLSLPVGLALQLCIIDIIPADCHLLGCSGALWVQRQHHFIVRSHERG